VGLVTGEGRPSPVAEKEEEAVSGAGGVEKVAVYRWGDCSRGSLRCFLRAPRGQCQ
jgi:hypothetical protein